jgi:hypothetical protein
MCFFCLEVYVCEIGHSQNSEDTILIRMKEAQKDAKRHKEEVRNLYPSLVITVQLQSL